MHRPYEEFPMVPDFYSLQTPDVQVSSLQFLSIPPLNQSPKLVYRSKSE